MASFKEFNEKKERLRVAILRAPENYNTVSIYADIEAGQWVALTTKNQWKPTKIHIGEDRWNRLSAEQLANFVIGRDQNGTAASRDDNVKFGNAKKKQREALEAQKKAQEYYKDQVMYGAF